MTENKYLLLIFLAVMVLVVHRVVNTPTAPYGEDTIPVSWCTHTCVMNTIEKHPNLTLETLIAVRGMCKDMEQGSVCDYHTWFDPGYHFKHK